MNRLVVLGIVLTGWLLGARSASADISPDAVRLAKTAMARIEIDSRYGHGSAGDAFCIRPDGIFVTMSHVVAGRPSSMDLRLIVGFGEKKPRNIKARVVRIDWPSGVAILQADAKDLPYLELAKADSLKSGIDVVAFGYSQKKSPSAIAVNVCKITGWVKDGAGNQMAQIDKPLSQLGDGGPILNEQGQVIGVLPGLDAKGFLPVDQLEKLAARVDIAVSPRHLRATQQHEPQELVVRVNSFTLHKPECLVELTLDPQRTDARTFTGKTDGRMEVAFKVVPAPPGIQPRHQPAEVLAYQAVAKHGEQVLSETRGAIGLVSEPNDPAPTAPSAEVPLEAKRVTYPLPGIANDLVVGGGGRFLIIHLPQSRKIVIFDVAQVKITETISVGSDDILFAAGRRKLLILARDQNVVIRYNLSPFAKERSAHLPEDIGLIQGLVLGHSADGPALLVRGAPTFLDLTTLASTPVDLLNMRHFWGDNRPTVARVSADGKTFTRFLPEVGAWNLRLLTIDGDSFNFEYAHTISHFLDRWHRGRVDPKAPRLKGVAPLVPSNDGRLLFTTAGIYAADLSPVSTEPFLGTSCFPSCDPKFFLGVTEQDGRLLVGDRKSRSSEENRWLASHPPAIRIYATADQKMLAELKDCDDLRQPALPDGTIWPLTIDKRAHFYPAAKLLITIPGKPDHLVLLRLDLDKVKTVATSAAKK